MSQESKTFVDNAVGQLLPKFTGLDVKGARKIVKSAKKSLSKLYKEYADMLKKIEKEKAKLEAKKLKKEKKVAEKLAKISKKEAKERQNEEMVNLVVSGVKSQPKPSSKPVAKKTISKK